MNGLIAWASEQPGTAMFLGSNLTRITEPEEGSIPDFWKSIMASKILVRKFPPDFGPNKSLDVNNTTVLGGMCLLNTVEMKGICNREITFGSEDEFEKWFAGWYPRIDQVHETIGVPPGACRKIVYVSEDSFFSGRLSAYTGFDRQRIQEILRRVHEQQGHPTLVRYLRALGYSGEVSVVYTSDIESEMTVALSMWERMLGITFRKCDRDFAKVELMYTGFWLDILGIKKSAIIYESSGKMILKGWLKLGQWFKEQTYGSGINRNLGIVGYVPFLTSMGDSSVIPFDKVPNHQNHETFAIAENDIPWYVVNLLFAKRTVVEGGPLSLTKEDAVRMIRADLSQYFRK